MNACKNEMFGKCYQNKFINYLCSRDDYDLLEIVLRHFRDQLQAN